jgi:hypothetical protein
VRGHLAVVPLAVAGLLAMPASAQHRHLHESDSGRTIHVHRGDEISVRLPGGSGGYHRPRSSDGTIVHRQFAVGGYPDDADAHARFIARHRGTADLTSYNDYACLHTQPPCLPPQKDWIVHVVVG